MRRINKIAWLMLISLTLMALVSVSVPHRALAGDAGVVVDLVLSPATQTVSAGNTFEVTIQAQCNGQDVVGVDAYINFASLYFEVVDSDTATAGTQIAPGSTLTAVLLNSVDNAAGKINYSAGKLGAPYPAGTFTVATIAFRAKYVAANTSTNITFNISSDPNAPRRTEATSGSASVLHSATGANVNISAVPLSVARDVPSASARGQPFNVSISFTSPADLFNSIGVSDWAPAGWTVAVDNAWCTPAPFESKAENNRADYVWSGPYAQGSTFTAVYRVTVPNDAALQAYRFTGGELVYYIGETGPATVNITGDSQVDVIEGARIQGETWEVKGVLLGDVTLTLDGTTSVVSNALGAYQLTVATTGSHTIVASKAGFRNYTRTFNVNNLGDVITLDFKALYGLVPNAPNMTYVLACINKWKFPPEGLGLNMTKVLAVINAWKFPVQ